MIISSCREGIPKRLLTLLVDNEKLTKGPIHFIGIYGTVTENQVRKLLGNPEIVTLKEEFGIYVWECTLNIQMIFLAKCSTPVTTTTNYNQFRIWVNTIERRARASHILLRSFVEAGKLL